MLAVLGLEKACARLRVAARGAPRCGAGWTGPGGGGGGVGRSQRRRRIPMLRIYSVLLELIRSLRSLLRELERHDPDLARQCRRALCSSALNIAEGAYSRG